MNQEAILSVLTIYSLIHAVDYLVLIVDYLVHGVD